MKSPKVSVIIPVYNTQDYVEIALRSIMEQSLREIEIIVINDGSSDNSPAIIERIAAEDARIRTFSQTNKGLSMTRNRGLSEATGEFVYFMDSDDILEADALEVCYNRAKERNVDFLFFDAVSFDDNGNEVPEYDYIRKGFVPAENMSGTEMLMLLLQNGKLRVSSCLNFINAQFLKTIPLTFYPGIIHEDDLFSVSLYIEAHRTCYIDRVFFRRRVRSNSIMTNNFGTKNLHGYYTVADQLISLSKNKDHTEQKAIRIYLRQMFIGIMYKARKLPFSEKIRLFVRCLRRYPQYISAKVPAILFLK